MCTCRNPGPEAEERTGQGERRAQPSHLQGIFHLLRLLMCNFSFYRGDYVVDVITPTATIVALGCIFLINNSCLNSFKVEMSVLSVVDEQVFDLLSGKKHSLPF